MTITVTKHEFEGHPYVSIEAESGGVIDLTEAEWAELAAYAADHSYRQVRAGLTDTVDRISDLLRGH